MKTKKVHTVGWGGETGGDNNVTKATAEERRKRVFGGGGGGEHTMPGKGELGQNSRYYIQPKDLLNVFVLFSIAPHLLLLLIFPGNGEFRRRFLDKESEGIYEVAEKKKRKLYMNIN